MKRRIFSISLACVAVATLSSSCILEKRQATDGENDATFTHKAIAVSDFSEIQASGAIDIVYTQSEAGSDSVILEGGASAVNAIVVEQKGDALYFSQNSKNNGLGWVFGGNSVTFGKVDVRVSSRFLSKVGLSGANDLKVVGLLSTDGLYIETSGASELSLDSVVVANKIGFEMSGAGKVNVGSVEAKAVDVETSGAARFDGKVKNAESVNVDMSGAGEVDLNLVDCGKVACALSGAANIDLSGNCKTLSQSTSGASHVDTDDLRVTGKDE